MGRWLEQRRPPRLTEVRPETVRGFDGAQGEALRRGMGPLRAEVAVQRVGTTAERRQRVLNRRSEPRDLTPGLGTVVAPRGLRGLVADTARAIPRAVLSPALDVATRGRGGEFDPTGNRFARFLLGDEPVQSVGRRIRTASKSAQTISRDTKSPIPYFLAAGGVAGSTILDTLFEGRGTPVKAATERLLKRLATRLGAELPDDLVRSVARETTQAMAKKGAAQAAELARIEKKYLTLSTPPPPGPFDTDGYLKELTQAQKAARGGERGLRGRARALYREAKSKLIDSNAPIEDVLRTAEREGKFRILPERDITPQIDRVLRAPTLAGQFARDNGIERVIREADDLAALDQYMIAKQSQAVEARGFQTGRNLTKDRKLILSLQGKYEPQAAQVTAYSQKLLDYAVDSGLISRELADKLKEIYPDYVPLGRIFDEAEQASRVTGGKAVASLSKQDIVEKLTGGEGAIESPMQTILEKTHAAFTQGEKNKAAKMLADYAALPGNPFELRELLPGESAPHTISFLDQGVKRTFATTADIAQAAKALNVQQLNILGRLFALPVRIAKLGITGINLPFVGANVARDQLFTAVTSDNTLRTSLANPIVFVRSLFAALKHDELYEELVRAGGGGTSFDIARNQAAPTIARIRASRGPVRRFLYTVRRPGELLRAAEDIIGRSEEFTRLTQFKGTRDAGLAKGMTKERATIRAAQAARENSANFARRGEWGTVLNSAFLYLNAGIQGSRAFLRAARRSPGKTAAKVGGFMFMPMAAMTAWNLSDEKRKQVYADIPEYEKENNFIIIPPNPTQDEKGRWNVIKLPLPPGMGKLTVPVRRSMEQAAGLDPVKFGEIASALIGSVSPIEPDKRSLLSTLTPQAIKPALEMATNENFFTGLPQVPRSMENLSPELQARKNTSGTARLLAGAVDGSPIKVEEFVKGTFGGVGSQILNVTDRALAGLDIIPRDQIGGQDLADAILARFLKARGGAIEDRQSDQLKDVLTDQADERFIVKQEAEMLFEELSTLPPEEANAKATQLKAENPIVFEKLKEIATDNRLGLTYNDRLLKQLGVENGARAKFILDELQALPSDEERNTYVADLRRKKVITDSVLKQIRYLIAQAQ